MKKATAESSVKTAAPEEEPSHYGMEQEDGEGGEEEEKEVDENIDG